MSLPAKDKFEMSNELAIRLFGYDEHMTVKADNDGSIRISKDRKNPFNIVQHKKNLGEMNTTPTSNLFGTITVASLGLDGSRGERMDVAARAKNQEIWSRHLEGGIQSNDLLEFLKVAVENPTFTQLWDAGNIQRERAGEYGTDPQVGIKYNPVTNLDTGNKNVQVKTIVKTSVGDTDIVLDQFEVSSVPSYLHVIADIDKRDGTIRDALKESDEASYQQEGLANQQLTPEEQTAKRQAFREKLKQEKEAKKKGGKSIPKEYTDYDSRLDDRLLPPVSYDKSVTEIRKILQSTFGSYYSEDMLQTFKSQTEISNFIFAVKNSGK